jgi:hypothetical protein
MTLRFSERPQEDVDRPLWAARLLARQELQNTVGDDHRPARRNDVHMVRLGRQLALDLPDWHRSRPRQNLGE